MHGMTKKITVSLPDDIAERLSHEDNASAFVAESIRRRMLGETVRRQLREAGINVTEEGIAKAAEEDRRLEERLTPEVRRELRLKMDQVMADIRAHRW